jgi:DNA mismatch repair protein MutL
MTDGPTARAIRALDPDTVDRIAAGEVVERPASAVKELVENSLDADASRVAVTVESGGIDGVVVRDDGVGMSREGVRAAVREHTTSKIRDIDDLEGGVGTLGFRGEALHAIGAVSRLAVRTRERGSETGTELRLEGGEVTGVERVGCPEGTIVEVEDLFYNVPARRKYLKQPETEFDHVNRVVTGYALANPEIAISLEHGDRETFATTGRGDLQGTVLSVYGREVAENTVPIGLAGAGERGEGGADGPLHGVSGLVSHPETNRASRDYLTTFVNGRYVTARVVREAVVEAYGRQLAADRYPFAVVRLEVDPATIDVNVHPRKLEVRFADEEGVRERVREAVREGLLEAGLLRSTAPRGRSQAGETRVQPELSGEGDGTERGDEALGGEMADGRSDAGAVAGPSTPASDPDGSVEGTRDADASTGDGSAGGRADTGASGTGTNGSTAREPAESKSGTATPGTGVDREHGSGRGDRGSTAEPSASASGEPGATERDPHRRFRESPAQSTLGGTDPSEEAAGALDVDLDRLPPMRVLGQVHDTYVVAETPDGVVLIDQHAADERVNYERLRERLGGDVTTQTLVEPVAVEVTPREAELFEGHGEALARLGFRASLGETGDRVVVRTVPAVLAGPEAPELVRDLLADFVDGDPAGTVEAAVDDLLGDMACYPAIKGNESLAEGSVVALLSELDACENPYACPHGRPVLVELGTGEIEARFERDYPGHGGRRDS